MSLIISLEQRGGSLDINHVKNLSKIISPKSEILSHNNPAISKLPGDKAPVVILTEESYLYSAPLNKFIAQLISYLSKSKVWDEVVDVDIVTPSQTIRIKEGNWQS